MVIFWRISNSRRILRRELLNIRRELLDSLREFSNSRRNLDENCWIRGENPVKSRQPNCIKVYSPLLPCLAKWRAVAAPMPALAPVTNTVQPFNEEDILVSMIYLRVEKMHRGQQSKIVFSITCCS